MHIPTDKDKALDHDQKLRRFWGGVSSSVKIVSELGSQVVGKPGTTTVSADGQRRLTYVDINTL